MYFSNCSHQSTMPPPPPPQVHLITPSFLCLIFPELTLVSPWVLLDTTVTTDYCHYGPTDLRSSFSYFPKHSLDCSKRTLFSFTCQTLISILQVVSIHHALSLSLSLPLQLNFIYYMSRTH
ncbi:hypothetical protein BYT27DRAFT_6965051 [Phlegmacium glaucopus]|nr:hypothetical protein BYT27DRAFT_6965051 [Phlegmacium glaucopus]